MLKALYDYAMKNNLVLPPGYSNKTIKAYVSLSKKGEFLGIILGDDTPVLCPDIGSLANGKEKCNPIVEKRSVIFKDLLDQEDKTKVKRNFYYQVLKDGSDRISEFEVCVKMAEDEKTLLLVAEALNENKIKGSDRISFIVDGKKIVQAKCLKEWWDTYRKKFFDIEKKERSLCLITGEETVPMETVPPVNGLAVVGGHARGDALICFDKSAFCSYDQKKSVNAPVSENAFFAVKAALDHLLEHAPVLANMKFVHWYEQNIEDNSDPILRANFLGITMAENVDVEEDISEDDRTREARIAEIQASKLVKSVTTGEKIPSLSNQYTICLLSGVNGRVMIRQYERGSYEELQKNVALWNEQLELKDLNGIQNEKSKKLNARLLCLLKKQNSDSKIWERVGKELPEITQAIIGAIINGTPLPDVVAVRSLAYIRSQMLEKEENSTSIQIPDATACQWLKVWLMRRKGAEIMSEYDSTHKSAAYHCGAAMAVHAAIQNVAMKNVNATIVQRYYSSASQMPALVLGQISRLSAYHLEKIENEWLRKQYEDTLNDVYCAIGKAIPATLTLEEQAYFALGYRQMCTKLQKDKNERIAKKKNNVED
ncbi:type I-C CRISPR-associated protein Cas8c/Csd1 [Blautia faecis]|uniref:type I-C CRISPR-associated protein Cas8c/Csd1 n=1 Tax=Blautia faecis TaxID=871665 RepID=UPI001D073ACD|nr:type I-C CRISPR-associated protein Cas8c/Csd1 [Blautia faecis]MCB6580076.1 type I-C CRISPR-associated protein Cas8c/Csd1 [Blautia faecis]MCB7292208.1 type I-C CRISPR-associated protein Cas8c/Csd1 [Blautia faecis]